MENLHDAIHKLVELLAFAAIGGGAFVIVWLMVWERIETRGRQRASWHKW